MEGTFAVPLTIVEEFVITVVDAVDVDVDVDVVAAVAFASFDAVDEWR